MSYPPNVWVLDLDETRPVFHAPTDEARDLGPTFWELTTVCGLWTYRHDGDLSQPEDTLAKDDARGHWIPTRHATRFARPCARCFTTRTGGTP